MLYADDLERPNKMKDACTRQAQRTALPHLPSAYALRTAQSRRACRHSRGPVDCAAHDFSTPGCASLQEGIWKELRGTAGRGSTFLDAASIPRPTFPSFNRHCFAVQQA